MDYRKFSDIAVIRLDKGEEIVRSLLSVCEKEKIVLAQVSAIGAMGSFELRVFDTHKKQYLSKKYEGLYEIVSLSGSVTQMDGKPYAHLHMAAGDAEGSVVGGHLGSAVISATCEIFLQILDGNIRREFDEEIGLNLMRFE